VFFWLEHLVLLFPISLLFPAAIRATLRAKRDRTPWISDEGLLLLCWFLVIGVGISFSNIQDYYLMIAWAPIAVWVAWAATRNAISFKWPALIIALLGALGLTLFGHGRILAVVLVTSAALASTVAADLLQKTGWRVRVPYLHALLR